MTQPSQQQLPTYKTCFAATPAGMTPRTPSELQPGGCVLSKQGEDVTAQFVAGAERAMAICREHGCTGAILKARSPSCGKGVIYDGSFTGKHVPGSGVFAQMLLDAGVSVMTEEE